MIPQLCTIGVHLSLNGQFWLNRLNVDAKKILEGFLECHRLGKKQARVQGKDRKIKMVQSAEVDHHQTCPLKTGANGCAGAKGFPCPGQNLFNWQIVEAQIERSGFVRRERRGVLQFALIKAADEQSLAASISQRGLDF